MGNKKKYTQKDALRKLELLKKNPIKEALPIDLQMDYDRLVNQIIGYVSNSEAREKEAYEAGLDLGLMYPEKPTMTYEQWKQSKTK